MTKHVAAFRDNYLAAILTVAVILLSVGVQAQTRPYQLYPAYGGDWNRIRTTQTFHIPYGSTPSLNGGYADPGALYYVVTSSGDTTLFSWTGSRWKREGGSGSGSGGSDSTHTLIFSTQTFDHWLVLAGQDPITGEWLYNDSISLKGPLPVNNQFFGMRGGVAGFYTLDHPSVLEAGANLPKSYHILGNGYTQYYDSMGIVLRQKSYLAGGNDTMFALYSGSNPSPTVLVTQSGGLKVNALTAIGNSFSFVPSSGMRITGLPLILSPGANNSRIVGEQQPIDMIRTYPGVPNNGAVNYHTRQFMDTINGSVYGYPTKDKMRFLSGYYIDQVGDTTNSYWIDARGYIYTSEMAHAANQDTFVVRANGMFQYRTLAEVIAAVGGATDLTPTTQYVFSNTTITEPADGRIKTYLVNPSSGTITMSNPASPTEGKIIAVHFFDINPGGSVIVPTWQGPKTLTKVGSSVILQWSDILSGYVVLGESGTTASGSGLGKVYAGNGLTNVNDSTLKVDTTLQATKLRTMQVVDSITKARNIPASFTSGTSITVDYATRAAFIGTLSHNAALTVSNMHAGTLVLYIINGSGGPYTFTAPGNKVLFLKPNVGDTTMAVGQWNGSAWFWGTDVQYSTSGGKETFTATAGQTAFTIVSGTLPTTAYKIFVFRNGVEIDFTHSGNIVTIPASTVGDNIKIRWYN